MPQNKSASASSPVNAPVVAKAVSATRPAKDRKKQKLRQLATDVAHLLDRFEDTFNRLAIVEHRLSVLEYTPEPFLPIPFPHTPVVPQYPRDLETPAWWKHQWLPPPNVWCEAGLHCTKG